MDTSYIFLKYTDLLNPHHYIHFVMFIKTYKMHFYLNFSTLSESIVLNY